MKHIIILFGIIIGFSIQIKAQKNQGYTLSCTFKGLPDKTKVYLTTQQMDTIQRAISNGDKFTFKGKLEPNGEFLFIRFDSLATNVGPKAIFVLNKEIKVDGVMGHDKINVIGSPEQEEYNEVLTKIAPKEFNRANSSIQLEFGALIKNWLLDHKTSLFAPYTMRSYLRHMQPDQIKEVFSAFTPAVKKSYYGRLLKLEIEAAAIVKGSVIPDFPLKNLQGKIENIHDLIKGNKYTLIDCWASWCSPCRAEVPKLKLVYEKYKSKGLNILGISSDKKEVDWKKAVADDQTLWKHVLEVNGNLTKAFSLGSIPAYILLDSEGKLLAFDCSESVISNFGGSLRGEDLDSKLEELLGK